MNKALFLDRDGVINLDCGYVYKKEDFIFTPGIFQLLCAAKAKGYLVIVVTNQAGIGRGYYTENDFAALMEWVKNELSKQGASLDAVLHCPFHPVYGIGRYKKESALRKPAPGMILQAAREHELDLRSSILVGDSPTDIQAGLAAGVGKLFFYRPKNMLIKGAQTITRLPDIIPFL
jgi:D-glycero-D-manno-heptose 1,7-bisphosphate phosphatase